MDAAPRPHHSAALLIRLRPLAVLSGVAVGGSMDYLVYVVITVIIIVIALSVRRYSDPQRLERQRYERLKELGQKLDDNE